MVTYRLDLSNLPPLTEAQKAELDALAARADSEIDFSDIPELTDEHREKAVRIRGCRPVKQQITARVDSDVLHWLNSQGKGYQSRMNAILRKEMLASLKRYVRDQQEYLQTFVILVLVTRTQPSLALLRHKVWIVGTMPDDDEAENLRHTLL